MLRFGIIGLGKMGRLRAREILLRNDAELVAVCDSDPEKFAGLEHIASYSEAKELLALDLDAVVIAAYNKTAAAYTIAALESNKHVLCEKPPARSIAELEEVAKVERDSKKILKYGFNHRYHYSVMEAKKLIDRQAFGELLWVKGTYGKAGRLNYDREWRSDISLAGGGILLDQGIHMLDLMLLFAGPVSRVSSIVQSSYWKTPVEDNVFAIMTAASGASLMLHSSAVLWRHRFQLELCFEDGLIALEGILSSTHSYGDETLIVVRREIEDQSFALGKPREERTYFDQDNSGKLELEEFVQAVYGRVPLVNGTMSDALTLMQTIEEIYEASEFYNETDRRNPRKTR